MDFEYHALYNNSTGVLVLAAEDKQSDMVFATKEMALRGCSLDAYLYVVSENPISRLMNKNQFKDFYGTFKDIVCANMAELVEEAYIKLNE